MTADDRTHSTTLSDAAVRRVLARAAELDAAQAGRLTVRELREAAAEAGLSPEALSAALAEQRADEARGTGTKQEVPPWWVRLPMTGVPDRRAARAYYWLQVALLLGWPLLLLTAESKPAALKLVTIVGGAALLAVGIVNTSSAIRWLDRHGWDRLK